ncbi:MAG: FAD-binding oxidoreductase [Deltaproteobacteria bacterium]|nr:FAD-binding oxidoreductase [Deltaproteobacteria bacterium]
MPSYDVVVIGAGSVGCPSAYFLARRGLKVLMVESRPACGQGQNKAAIGGVRATHSDPAKIQICRQSLDVFSSWKEEHGFDLGWKKGGYCFPVYDERLEQTLKNLVEAQQRYGLNIDWVDADRVKDMVPGIEPRGLRGGTFSPDDGQVSPLLASEGFRRAGVALGVEYRFNEPVTDLVVESSRICAVVTTKARYPAKMVLVAAGAKAKAIGAMAGINLPVTPDSHEAGITAPVAQFIGPLVVDLRPGPEGRTANFYFGQNNEGQIIFCYTPKKPLVGEDRRPTSEFLPIVTRRLLTLLPRLRNMVVRRTWRGLYPMTPDGVPICDRIEGIDGLFVAVGMCGQGFMLGPGIGMNMTSVMLDGHPEIDPDVFASLRYDRSYEAGHEALK